MSFLTVTPVLLCGGSGTRLRPLSRKSYPKQFLLKFKDLSMFQASARCLSDGSESFVFARPTIVTGDDFRFIVTEQLAAIGIDFDPILIEPKGRNTAPAVLAAALHFESQDPDAVLLVAPLDHIISSEETFRAAVAEALPAIAEGCLVTFSITPDRPETGYSYLELTATTGGGPEPLRRFVKKPDVGEATRMLATGNYFWNAGILLFRSADVTEAYRTHAPEMVSEVSRALGEGQVNLGFLRLAPEPWGAVPDISIDYTVMEKAPNLFVQRYSGHWSHLGGWDAVWRESGPNGRGLPPPRRRPRSSAATGCCARNPTRSRSSASGLRTSLSLPCPTRSWWRSRDRAQDVNTAVFRLKARGVVQAGTLPRNYRPWGRYKSLVIGGRFQVKRIVVHPGAALSLQSYHHRAEHWIVAEGTARVIIDDEVRLVTEPVGLRVARIDASDGESGQGADGADRDADRRLSRRGRHHLLRGRLCPQARGGGVIRAAGRRGRSRKTIAQPSKGAR